MKSIVSICLVLLFPFFAFTQEKVSPAKAAELSVHRVERLVILKKIPQSFLDHLIEIRLTETSDESQPFVSEFFLESTENKTANLRIWMDNSGKAIKHELVSESLSPSPFTWPNKDSATLLEEGLHFVLEGWAQHPEVKIYFDKFESIALKPKLDGEILTAEFTVSAVGVSQKLHIFLKDDGTFISYELR